MRAGSSPEREDGQPVSRAGVRTRVSGDKMELERANNARTDGLHLRPYGYPEPDGPRDNKLQERVPSTSLHLTETRRLAAPF